MVLFGHFKIMNVLPFHSLLRISAFTGIDIFLQYLG